MTSEDANAILSSIIGRRHTYNAEITGFLIMLARDGYTYSASRIPDEAEFQKAFDLWSEYTPAPTDGQLRDNRSAPWIIAGARMIAGGKSVQKPTPTPSPAPAPSPSPVPTPTTPGLSDAQKAQLRQHLRAIETLTGL